MYIYIFYLNLFDNIFVHIIECCMYNTSFYDKIIIKIFIIVYAGCFASKMKLHIKPTAPDQQIYIFYFL